MAAPANNNSYLTLRLATMSPLRNLALRIAQEPKALLLKERLPVIVPKSEVSRPCGPKDVVGEQMPADEKTQQGSDDDVDGDVDLGFEAQEHLHITFVFFGEALSRAPKKTIDRLHATVTGFVEGQIQNDEGTVPVLTVEFFEFFPPEKHNLIVAKLRFANKGHELSFRRFFLEVHAIAETSGLSLRGAPDWSSITGKSASSRSVPEGANTTRRGKKQTRTSAREGGRVPGPAAEEDHAPPADRSIVENGSPSEDADDLLTAVRNLSDDQVFDVSGGVWQPHVTLGKIRATRKVLSRLELCRVEREAGRARSLEVVGFSMVPTRIPRRAWSDWAEGLVWAEHTEVEMDMELGELGVHTRDE